MSYKILWFPLLAFLAIACDGGFERFAPPANSISGRGAKQNPRILSTTPADGATVSPVTGTNGTQITVIFDMTMNPATTPVINTYVRDIANNSLTWLNVANSGATFTWSSTSFANDTLTIQLGWVRWPEDNVIGFDFNNDTLINLDDMPLSNSTRFSFTVGWNPGRYKIVPTGQYACYYYSKTDDVWKEQVNCTAATSPEPAVGDQDFPAGQNGFVDPMNPQFGPGLYGTGSSGIVNGRRFITGANPQNLIPANCTGNASDPCYPYSADSVTTLIWQTCSLGQIYQPVGDKCYNSGTDFTWGEAVNACSAMNSADNGQGYGGRKDWRLPTIEEIEGLVDYGARNTTGGTVPEPGAGYPEGPAIHGYQPTAYPFVWEGPFPNTPITKGYWSATGISALLNGTVYYGDAYVVEFKKGTAGAGGGSGALLESARKTSNRKKVRCVAGPTVAPPARSLTPATKASGVALTTNSVAFNGYTASPGFTLNTATPGLSGVTYTLKLDILNVPADGSLPGGAKLDPAYKTQLAQTSRYCIEVTGTPTCPGTSALTIVNAAVPSSPTDNTVTLSVINPLPAAPPPPANFYTLHVADFTTDGANIFVADATNNKIRKIATPAGVVTTIAGSGAPGAIDATGIAATFSNPNGVANDGTNIYVADTNNHKIRKIVISTGVVTTLAGSGVPGAADATGALASFNSPYGLTSDGTSLYVADTTNNKIRKVVISSGVVTTLAGSGVPGSTDATGVAATFTNPSGVTNDGTNVYVADRGSHKIRKIVISSGVVTTLAGSGATGSTDATGTAATFTNPSGVTYDSNNVYVADQNSHKIRKIVIASGIVTTLAGSGVPGNTDATGTAATFNQPYGIVSDGTNLYVADTISNKIRKVVISSGVVSTLAGSGLAGSTDATGTAAAFDLPIGATHVRYAHPLTTKTAQFRGFTSSTFNLLSSVPTNANTLSVVFNKIPNTTEASDFTRYCVSTNSGACNAALAVTAVTLSGRVATLTTAAQAPGTQYYVFVNPAGAITTAGDNIVNDAVNNLAWQRCRHGVNDLPTCTDDGDASNDGLFWNDALNYCNSLNAANYAGVATGWRAPTINELKYLATRNTVATLGYAIDTTIFPTPNPVAEDYAASTNYSMNGPTSIGSAPAYNLAWAFNYIFGTTSLSQKDYSELLPANLKPPKKSVRCVRTGTIP